MDNRINKTEILHHDDLGLEQIKNQHVLFTWANYILLSTGVIIILINLDFGLIFIVFINMRRTPSL